MPFSCYDFGMECIFIGASVLLLIMIAQWVRSEGS